MHLYPNRIALSGVIAALLIAAAPVHAQQLAAVTAEESTIAQWRELDGTVEAVNESTVAAQTSGTVTALHADVQDFVPAGKLIVEIDDTVQRAQLEQAKASLAEARAGLAEARTRFSRIRNLYERKAVSKSEYDQTLASYNAAKARVDAGTAAVSQAEQQLQYTRVTAPYDGVVVERHVEIGETVSPGAPLMTGASLKQLRVTTQVPQHYADAVRKAGTATVALPDGGTLDSGSLTFYPVADTRTHDFRVRVALPEGSHGLFPGMTVKVRFPVGERRALLVPRDAVLYRSELRAVYVIADDGRPRLRQIRLGELHDDRVEVLAGLSAGERIAADPTAAMAVIAGGRGE
ncbi:MAG: efflux RND transporter periplasmic adaptor subunit [Ectothiorhodospiraceae bacterium]|jgi:RND family efflux transporter MFP subunit